LVDRGVNEKRANDAFKSFSVRIKVNKSKLNTVKYKISGVPTFIVNGKYLVDSKHAGSEKRLFKIINHLIKREAQ
jgi:thiol:disulfide interchange protein DsbA